jgi:hypothetical protein
MLYPWRLGDSCARINRLAATRHPSSAPWHGRTGCTTKKAWTGGGRPSAEPVAHTSRQTLGLGIPAQSRCNYERKQKQRRRATEDALFTAMRSVSPSKLKRQTSDLLISMVSFRLSRLDTAGADECQQAACDSQTGICALTQSFEMIRASIQPVFCTTH